MSKGEKDVNQIHQCLNETTSIKKNILGVIPKKVELEPLLPCSPYREVQALFSQE